jgi:hypothetical protein
MLSRSANQPTPPRRRRHIIGASIFVQPSVITGAVPTVSGVFGVCLRPAFSRLRRADRCRARTAHRTPAAYVFSERELSPAVDFWAMF